VGTGERGFCAEACERACARAPVFTATGSDFVDSKSSSSASVPTLAAVSPKRASGACDTRQAARVTLATK
jgi:hypothetical protein